MRINCIPVNLLADQHLRAEYNEIHGMMPTYYRRSIIERKEPFNDNEIPENYTMSTGHARFFYDKFGYVVDRWNEIIKECNNRGYITNLEKINTSLIKENHFKNWEPNINDIYLNIERILNRIYKKIFIDKKPGFYTYKGESMKFVNWCLFYTNELNLEFSKVHAIIIKIEEGKAI